MHHTHIDRFAVMSSPLHAVDARVKLITTVGFILLVVLTPDGYFISYGLYVALMSVVIFLSHVPPLYILKRSLTLLPFILVISIFIPFITSGPSLFELSIGPISTHITSSGLIRFFSIGFRAFISFLATILLVSTTRFGDLMRAASVLGLPSIMVVLLSFMYRYLFILVDEAAHMLIARDLRGSKRGLPVLVASGGIVGALLVRSFEHADKLYAAMLLRGYTGQPVTLTPMRFKSTDIVISIFFLGIAVLGLIAGGLLVG